LIEPQPATGSVRCCTVSVRFHYCFART
jgi:hypothetical protein